MDRTSGSPIMGMYGSPAGGTQRNTQLEDYTEQDYSALTEMKESITKDPARIQYLVEKILEVCRDMKSARFYSKVARALPDEVIFRFLSEIKQDETIKNRGAVFTSKAKRYASRRHLEI